MFKLIIPFNSQDFVEDPELLEAMIYSVECKDINIVFEAIENMLSDSFEDEHLYELEQLRLTELVDKHYDILYTVISPLIPYHIPKDHTIEGINILALDRLNSDTVISFSDGGYSRYA